jgi:hypothetical protein
MGYDLGRHVSHDVCFRHVGNVRVTTNPPCSPFGESAGMLAVANNRTHASSWAFGGHMIIEIMSDEPVVLPRGLVVVRWTEDKSSVGRYYDGVLLVGAEPNEQHEWRIRILDCTDVQAMMRVLCKCNPVGKFQLDYIELLATIKTVANPCLLPPPSLDEL